MDAQRLRPFASDEHLQEIGQLRIAILRHEARDGEAASRSARSAYEVQDRRFDVGERHGAVAGRGRNSTARAGRWSRPLPIEPARIEIADEVDHSCCPVRA
jgi:hypothetical protein